MEFDWWGKFLFLASYSVILCAVSHSTELIIALTVRDLIIMWWHKERISTPRSDCLVGGSGDTYTS